MKFCTPRAQKKSRQILDGATCVFDAQGFEGASVDVIAETADVSKATLYKYFANKQDLFSACIERQCEVYSERMIDLSEVDGPLEDNLRIIASTIGQTFTSPVLANLFRLAIAETGRFPEIGRAIFDQGPQKSIELISAILKKHIETGELAITDIPRAARQFQALVKADFFDLALFGIRQDFSPQELQQSAENAVQTFLRAYRVG